MRSKRYTGGQPSLMLAEMKVSSIISVSLQSKSQTSVTFLLLPFLAATNMPSKLRAPLISATNPARCSLKD